MSASSIPPFSVIFLPYAFMRSGVRFVEKKLFVVLGHQGNSAFCIKTTSNLNWYNTPDKLDGVVIYEIGDTVFNRKTAVQPDNDFLISHAEIDSHDANGDLVIFGQLPADFKVKILEAIDLSIVLSNADRTILKEVIA